MIRHGPAVVALVCSLSCVAAAAAAQDVTGAALVNLQFDRLEAQYDVAPTMKATGRLRHDGVATGVIEVPPGREFVIIGRCDEQCLSLGLMVRGPNGVEVGRDLFSNDVPIVRISASSGGRFTYEVRMSRCLLDCAYGVRTYDGVDLPLD